MNSIFQEIRRSYKIPVIICIFAAAVAVSLKFQIGMFGAFTVFGMLMVGLPLLTAMASFTVSRKYGNSKIFGRSYFLLSCGFFCIFLGELLYFVYGGKVGQNVMDLFDYFFLFGYLFSMFHIIINIRYFAEKFYAYQKLIAITIPILIVFGYSYLVYENMYELDYFYFNLIFVSASAVNLGLAVVGFTLFRHTILISAWFLILMGIFVGTIGHLEFRYYHALGLDAFGNVLPENYSVVFWFSSFLILIYGLYKHQKLM